MNLKNPLRSVLALCDDAAPAAEAIKLAWEPLVYGAEAEALVEAAIEAGECLGVSAQSSEPTTLFDDREIVCAIHAQAGTALFEGDAAKRMLAHLMRESGNFAALDAKALIHHVSPKDSSAPALLAPAEVLSICPFDLGLAAYVLNSSASAYTLETLFETYAGAPLPKPEGTHEAEAVRAAAVAALAAPLRKALQEAGGLEVCEHIDFPLVGVLALMERNGAAIDTKRMATIRSQAAEELAQLSREIYAEAGEEFNIDSPKQLSHILFEVLGLPPTKKTQRGYSTNAAVLKDLSKLHALPDMVLRYRELAKIKSTYLDALPAQLAGDGFLHTSFNQTITATGRLSSSDPNLQNIPVRTDFGRSIRSCFTALEPGHVFVSADYSQIELRLLAHLSQDEGLIEAFTSGEDFHASTAARVFDVPVEEVTPALRSRAKAVNFGIVYGQQAFGLSQTLDIPYGQAKDMIDRYFAAYPRVRAYLDETVQEATVNGYATTMFGRRRSIPELTAGNQTQRGFGERTAMNHPMQGSAADVIKLAMVEVARRLVREGFEAKLMLQVHDELDFSVPPHELERLCAMVREVMQGVAADKGMRVALEVDVSSGATWAEEQ